MDFLCEQAMVDANNLPVAKFVLPEPQTKHWESSRIDPVVILSQQPLAHFLSVEFAHFEYTLFPQCPHRE
jgi:hypothetical protein